MSDEELAGIRRFNRISREYEEKGFDQGAAIVMALRDMHQHEEDPSPMIHRDPNYRKAGDQVVFFRSLSEIGSMTKQRGPYGFLTINADPKIAELSDLQHAVDKFFGKQRKSIEWYIYVYEQAGDTTADMGKHPHCHVLFRRGDTYSDYACKAEFQKAFARVCYVAKHNCLNLRWIPEGEVPIEYNYIMGSKHGRKQKSKMQKCEIDVIWRKLNDIEPYYPSWDLLGTRPTLLLDAEKSELVESGSDSN